MTLPLVETLVPMLFLGFFVASLLFGVDSRFPIAAGLGLIVLVAVIMAFNIVSISAEAVAVYAYYFLVIGVVLQLIRHIRKSERGILPVDRLKRVEAMRDSCKSWIRRIFSLLVEGLKSKRREGRNPL